MPRRNLWLVLRTGSLDIVERISVVVLTELRVFNPLNHAVEGARVPLSACLFIVPRGSKPTTRAENGRKTMRKSM